MIQNFQLLNEDQRYAYNKILENINNNKGEIFYIDAPGWYWQNIFIKFIISFNT